MKLLLCVAALRVLVACRCFHARKRNQRRKGNDMNRTIEKTEAELMMRFAEASRAISFWLGQQNEASAALDQLRAPAP